MIEYIDLALGLILIFACLIFVYTQYKKIPKATVEEEVYRNYKGVTELYHIVYTGVIKEFSSDSYFRIIFYSNGSLKNLIPGINLGGKKCVNQTYVNKYYGNLTAEICY